MSESPPEEHWSLPPEAPRRRRFGGGTAVGLVALIIFVIVAALVVLDGDRAADRDAVAAPTPAPTTTSIAPSATSTVSRTTGTTDAPTASELPAGIPTGFPTPVTLPTPTKRPSGRPSAATEPGRPSGDLEKPLVDNPLYDQQLKPTSCAQPPRPIPASEAAYRRYLGRMFDCLADAYRAPLKAAGFSLTRPYLVFFTGRAQTPCGTSPTELSVFYCSANETVYATRRGLDDYASMRLGLYYVVLHEYAHHVQERAGILDAARFRHEEWPQVSRRIELQAECMMGITLATITSSGFRAADRAELYAWRERVPDRQHGTSQSQVDWIDRGLATRSLGRCSTWRAPLDEVR